MSRHVNITARQLAMLVFLSLAVDMVIRPFTAANGTSAQNAILASVLDTAAVCLCTLPLLCVLRRPGFAVVQGGATWGSRCLLVLLALLFALGCAGGLLRAQTFYRYVSDDPLWQPVFYGIAFLVMLYALRCGLESLVRAAGLVLLLFLASVVLMLVSNWQQLRLTNLTFAPFSAGNLLQAALRGFTLPPELLLFCLLALRTDKSKGTPLLGLLGLLCVFYVVLTFFAEGVLGLTAQTQVQTIHTLSRLGSLSVFRRLDALHTGAWLLASLCKAAGLAYGVLTALTPLLPAGYRSGAHWFALAFTGGALLLGAQLPAAVLGLLTTAGTALALAGTTIYGYRMEGAWYDKKAV